MVSAKYLPEKCRETNVERGGDRNRERTKHIQKILLNVLNFPNIIFCRRTYLFLCIYLMFVEQRLTFKIFIVSLKNVLVCHYQLNIKNQHVSWQNIIHVTCKVNTFHVNTVCFFFRRALLKRHRHRQNPGELAQKKNTHTHTMNVAGEKARVREACWEGS